MIRLGTTAYADMYYYEEEIAQATKEAGIRGVLGQTIIQFPVPDAKTPADGIARAVAFIKQWSNDDLVGAAAIAPHSMYTLEAATLKEIRAVATREHAPVIIHLAETRDEVKVAHDRDKLTPTAFLESIGFWGERTIAAHGVHVTPADITILSKRHVGLSHNPESNMKLASGTSPVPALQRAGVVVGLGTDGCGQQQRSRHVRSDASGGVSAQADEQRSKRPAGANGAQDGNNRRRPRSRPRSADRFTRSTGKRADLLVVSMRSPRQTPMYDPLSHLVYVTRGDDVQTVVVNGKILMRDHKVLTVDETAVLAEAATWAHRVRLAVHKGQ